VFVTRDGGLMWNRENTGFANVSISSMKIENESCSGLTRSQRVEDRAPAGAFF
jgi:hypothetical protein